MDCDVAKFIETVITDLEAGKGLRSLRKENAVCTPRCYDRPNRRDATEATIVDTDFEPYDIFAISCLRAERSISVVR